MDSSSDNRAFNQIKTFFSTYKLHILLLVCGYLVLSVIFSIYGIDFHPKKKNKIDKVVIIDGNIKNKK